jgi:hypothetical protein
MSESGQKRKSGSAILTSVLPSTADIRQAAVTSEKCRFPPPARPPGHSPEEGSARASALRHPLPVALMLVALGDRTGRVPGSLDALDLLADLARGRAERVDADLAVRHAGAQRAELGCGIVLRQAEVERLVLQLGEIRRDLGSRIAPARLVLVGGSAQRPKADLGIGEARADMGKILRGVALALAQLGGLRLDLGGLRLDLGEIRRDLGSRIAPARLVLVGGSAQRPKADLGIGEARADMGKILRGVALALAQLGGLRLDLGEIRRDLGSRIAPARLVLVGGSAQRPKADLGIGEARADMGKILRGVALALAQLGGLRLDLGELCRQGSDAVLERHGSFARGVAVKLAREGEAVGADAPQHRAGARCERQTDGDTERGGRAAMREGTRRHCWFTHVQVSNI